MEQFVSLDRLEDALQTIRLSPSDSGFVEMIVCRPGVGEREVLHEAALSLEDGLVGDNWKQRGAPKVGGDARHLAMQINIMNSRTIDAIANADRALWPMAGDQLFVDFDLSADNLPAGTQLQVGEAVLEVTSEPHLGCRKFKDRFGRDAVAFVNSEIGKNLKLRGINARVIKPGVVTTGGVISKLAPF